MKDFTLQSIVARNAEIVTADMDGETVMMRVETGKYYSLGKMGSTIWAMLEEPLSVEAMIGRLMEQYAVEREQCEKEVLSFLCDTQEEGLIEIKSKKENLG